MPEGTQASLVVIATGRLQTTREIQNDYFVALATSVKKPRFWSVDLRTLPVGRVYNEPEVNPDLFVGEILGIERLSLKPGRQILK